MESKITVTWGKFDSSGKFRGKADHLNTTQEAIHPEVQFLAEFYHASFKHANGCYFISRA